MKTLHGIQDEIEARIERIVLEKQIANESVVGQLKSTLTRWDDLEKSIDDTVRAELERSEIDVQAAGRNVEAAPGVGLSEEDGSIVIGGHVNLAEEDRGLPGLMVEIIDDEEGGNNVLAVVPTDDQGAFVARIADEQLNALPAKRKTRKLRFKVRNSSNKKVSEGAKSIDRKSRAAVVDIDVSSKKGLKDNVAASRAVRDSSEKNLELTMKRDESMRATHKLVKDNVRRTRKRLESFAADLSSQPPDCTPKSLVPELTRTTVDPRLADAAANVSDKEVRAALLKALRGLDGDKSGPSKPWKEKGKANPGRRKAAAKRKSSKSRKSRAGGTKARGKKTSRTRRKKKTTRRRRR